VSYLEIYNEDVRDLLSKDQSQRLEVSVYSGPLLIKSLQPKATPLIRTNFRCTEIL